MSILNDKETSIESTTKILDMVGGTTGLRRNTHNSITAILLLTGVLAVGGCTKENTHAQPNSPTSPLSSENEMKTQGKKSHIDDTQDTSTHRLTKKQTQHLDARISETERTMWISIEIVIADVARTNYLGYTTRSESDQTKTLTIYLSRNSAQGKSIAIIPASYENNISGQAIQLFRRNNILGAVTEVLKNIQKDQEVLIP